MPTPVTPPASLADLYLRAPAAAVAQVGATNHVVAVVDGGDLTRACRFADAVFLPRSASVVIRREIGVRLQRFLDLEFTSRVLSRDGQERWHLAVVKGDLGVMLHECLHGAGPPDPRMMAAEWNAYWQFPGVRVLNEGTCELVGEVFLNRFLVALGLDAVDPRLLEVKPVRTGHIAEAEAVRAMLTDLASELGTTVEDEIASLAREGAARLGCWRLAIRLTRVRWLGRAQVLRRPGPLIEVLSALEQPFAQLASDWAAGRGVTSMERDIETGRRWGHAAATGLRDAARRIAKREA